MKNSEYNKMRDDFILSFLPHKTSTTKNQEKLIYRQSLSQNNSYLEKILYGDIWDYLLINEKLAIENLYYENPDSISINTRFYQNIHAYIEAKQLKQINIANKHLYNNLWEILYNLPTLSSNPLEHDKENKRRKSQASMLKGSNINYKDIKTPDYILKPIRERYASTPLEILLPDIIFPIDKIAREIAEEIQQINIEIRQEIVKLTNKKSIVWDSRNSSEATDAFIELVHKIIKDVRKEINTTIDKLTNESKTEAEILDSISKTIDHYQEVTIPHKVDMLANHFHGKLTEVEQRKEGYTHYIWRSLDDEKVRPDHAANDGKIFSWNNPPPTGHPGEDYNCRCYAEPAFKDPPIEPVYPELILIPATRVIKLIKNGIKLIKKASGRVRKSKVKPSTSNPESLRGMSAKKVEKIADKELLSKGWKKEPLRDGNGVRYTNGKGGSFEINRGYPKKTWGDKMHKGPYIKTTIGHTKIRQPLKGNPELR